MPTESRYIESITIRGFKSIAAIEDLELRPINILIGANGSGKSNFIGAFDLWRGVQWTNVDEYVDRQGGAARILHFGPKMTREISVMLRFRREMGTFSNTLLASKDDILYSVGSQMLPPVDWRIFHVHDTSTSSPLRRRCKLDNNAYLREDGENLPAVLYHLRLMHADSYQMIRKTVQLVAPFFADFQLHPMRNDPDSIKLEWLHKGSDAYFDATSLSDGTLRFMALATYFLQPDTMRPSLFLVDEPELGLHPKAISILAALIKQASVETQVIVTTQSPILLDYFEPEDTLVADRVDNATQIRRLERAPLASWLEEYSLGQLWEKNYLGGRP